MNRLPHQVLLFALAALVLSWPGSAHATVFGNPAPDFKKGELGLGIGLSNNRETLFLDWGASDAGTLQFLLGTVEIGTNTDGTEFGGGYRHKIGERFKIGESPVRLGALGFLRIGEADNGNVEFNQLDVGFGGAFTPVELLNVFAFAVYERIEIDSAQTVNMGGNITGGSKTESDIGIVLGTEYWADAKLVLGAEIHFSFDGDDLGFYAAIKF